MLAAQCCETQLVSRSVNSPVAAAGLEGLAMPGLAVLLGSGGYELAVARLRSDGRVGQELADLLSATAGDGDLGSPPQRLLARGHVDDRESAEVLHALRVGARR